MSFGYRILGETGFFQKTRFLKYRKTFDLIGRIHELGDWDLPDKFRIGDIRAERCILHGNGDKFFLTTEDTEKAQRAQRLSADRKD